MDDQAATWDHAKDPLLWFLDQVVSDERAVDRGEPGAEPFGPRRVRAECEAKRAMASYIAGMVTGVPSLATMPVRGTPDAEAGWTLLAMLALPYADRPGFPNELRLP